MTKTGIIFLVGPTAVGKSRVAEVLAQRLSAEIVSCDAMQVYREVNIMSDKPTDDALKRTGYHLINLCSIEEEYDVARWRRAALHVLSEVHERGQIPIFAGGSGLYMQVLLDGIFEPGDPARRCCFHLEAGGPDNHLREKLLSMAQSEGRDYLYQKLIEKDQKAAAQIHPHDLKRVVRALEVCLASAAPFSKIRTEREGIWGKYKIGLFFLNRDRAQLYQRIEERVGRMFERGCVEEIRSLSDRPWSRTALGLIGVKEVLAYLRNEMSLESAKDLIKQNTRRLAKRQLTWFRKEKRLMELILNDESPEETAELILQRMER